MHNLFKNRTLFIATKHKKEEVLAPLLTNRLGVIVKVATIDTDLFGTFSGEIIRQKTALETLKDKCYEAIKLQNIDLVVASEGSFGPHPSLGFIPCNEEYLMLVDIKNNLEIVVKEFSIETNFATAVVNTQEELIEFADKVNFPRHKVILRKSLTDFTFIKKDIESFHILISQFNEIKAHQGFAYVETDMRAMNNPSRMKVIEKAGLKLIDKLFKSCPSCNTIGYDVTRFEGGLPCSWCGLPTNSIMYSISSCLNCNFTEKNIFPNGKKNEDPQYCSFCNP